MENYCVACIATIIVDAESAEHALEVASEIDANEWNWSLDEVCNLKDLKEE